MDKKGLSPVIATVLLISLVLVLATIIFLWARAFIPEKVQKFDSPIEDSCKNVVFEASYGSEAVTVQNNGNVPIYSIQVGVKKGIGSLSYIEVNQAPIIVAGGSGRFELISSSDVDGSELIILPVLLGKTSNGELRAFACSDESAKTIQA